MRKALTEVYRQMDNEIADLSMIVEGCVDAIKDHQSQIFALEATIAKQRAVNEALLEWFGVLGGKRADVRLIPALKRALEK